MLNMKLTQGGVIGALIGAFIVFGVAHFMAATLYGEGTTHRMPDKLFLLIGLGGGGSIGNLAWKFVFNNDEQG